MNSVKCKRHFEILKSFFCCPARRIKKKEEKGQKSQREKVERRDKLRVALTRISCSSLTFHQSNRSLSLFHFSHSRWLDADGDRRRPFWVCRANGITQTRKRVSFFFSFVFIHGGPLKKRDWFSFVFSRHFPAFIIISRLALSAV